MQMVGSVQHASVTLLVLGAAPECDPATCKCNAAILHFGTGFLPVYVNEIMLAPLALG
jgi:hypothetical protein